MNNSSIKWVVAAILILPLILQVAVSAAFLRQFFAVMTEVERKSNSRDFVMQCYALESKIIESFANLTLTIDSRGLIDPVATRNDCNRIEILVQKLVERCRNDNTLAPRAHHLKRVFDESKSFLYRCLDEQAQGAGKWKSANNDVPEGIIRLADKFMQSFNAIIDTQKEANFEGGVSLTDAKAPWHAIKQFLNLCLIGNAVLSVLLLFWFSQSVRKPLSKIAKRCDEIAQNQQLSLPLKSKNEFGQLDRLIYSLGINLKETRESEKAMVSNARDMICSIDAQGIFKDANDYTQTLLGYSADQIIGRSFLDFCFREDTLIADDAIRDLKNFDDSRVFEVRLQQKDETPIDTRWSCVLSEGAVVVVVHDISEEKNLARLKQDFLNMVSHDLRSPLTSLMASFSMLAQGVRGELPAGAKQEVTSAVRNIEHLIELINDFLDLQKIESGNLHLEFSTVNLSELVLDTLGLLKGAIDAKHIQIIVGEEKIFLNADKNKFSRVIQNFLSNAIAYSPDGGTISVEFQLLQNDYLELRVLDEGQGIAEEYKEIIFEPFLQAPSAQSKAGTGLGLAICKLITEAHGGEIGVRDNTPSGAIFWVRIPTNSPTLTL